MRKIMIVEDEVWRDQKDFKKQFAAEIEVGRTQLVFVNYQQAEKQLRQNSDIRIYAIDLFAGNNRNDVKTPISLIREIRFTFRRKKVVVGMYASRIFVPEILTKVDILCKKRDLREEINKKYDWIS